MSVYYVDPTGSDANPGTLADPFETIAFSLSVLVAGDILNIRAGTYDEVIWESMVVTGTVSDPIVIQAYLEEAVVLQPTAECKAIRFESSARAYITLRGLQCDQSLATCTTEPVVSIDANQSNFLLESLEVLNGAANGIELAGANHQLIDVEAHDNAGIGINADVETSEFDVHVFANGSHGLVVAGNGNTVKYWAHGNTGDGAIVTSV